MALAISGCAGRYFSAAPAPDAPISYALDHWPYRELWTGIIFNGAKIGFAHTRISALDAAPAQYRIDSEASLLLRFMGFEKVVRVRASDVVDERLNLVRFDANYHLDGNDLEIHGTVTGASIEVDVLNAGRQSTRSIPVDGPVIPTSAVLMYPLVHGLAVGRAFRFQSFNGETLSVADVEQRVTGFEKSELFSGEAYKLVSRLQGQQTTSWLDNRGRPLLELALNGVMISELEEESRAKSYLATAALNKQEVMLDFSRVRVDRRIGDPRRVTQLELILHGAPARPPSTEGQRCARANDLDWLCSFSAGRGEPDNGADSRYLMSSLTVPWGDASVRKLASQIAGDEQQPRAKIQHILDWLQNNILKHPADAFSALDVLASRRAECQGHTYLYAALARAMGIPTRVVNGLVYSEMQQAFLFHTWAESSIDGKWRAVDPTFGQPEADATHIRIVEGEEPADLVPLTDWVGRLSIEVLRYGHDR